MCNINVRQGNQGYQGIQCISKYIKDSTNKISPQPPLV